MEAVTHLEKVIVGEVSAVTHLEKVIAGETSAVTYTEKVITGEATPITHLQKVIAGEAAPITHLEYVWVGRTPEPTEHEHTGVVPYTFNANGEPLLDWYIKGNTVQSGTPTPDNPIMPEGCGDLEATGEHAGQYKIPISSAGQTTPVYLGEVETTRKIKKLVFDGTEDWTQSSTDISYNRYKISISDMKAYGTRLTPLYCTHYQNISDGRAVSNVPNNSIYTGSGIDTYIKDTTFSSITDFKAYLAQQYAAGTPITVWYVLANEETAVVNEPLMKIGDYADEVSNVATIPTNNGSTTIDVETTVKPSEIYIKYKGV